jgi:hypothetical protein
MSDLPFRAIPQAPQEISAATVLTRLVDGLAFRYRWATEDLRSSDAEFRASPESKSIHEMLIHIMDLAVVADSNLGGEPPEPKGEDAWELEGIRQRTLGRLECLRNRLIEMSGDELGGFKVFNQYPFWNLVNGPMADALTHVGQINAWRRQAGNPPPKADVFRGLPPKEG